MKELSAGYDNLILARQKALQFEDKGLHQALLTLFVNTALEWKRDFDRGVGKLGEWWNGQSSDEATGKQVRLFQATVARDCDTRYEQVINVARAYVADDVK